MRNTSSQQSLAAASQLLLGVLAHMCLGEVPISAVPNGAPSMLALACCDRRSRNFPPELGSQTARRAPRRNSSPP